MNQEQFIKFACLIACFLLQSMQFVVSMCCKSWCKVTPLPLSRAVFSHWMLHTLNVAVYCPALSVKTACVQCCSNNFSYIYISGCKPVIHNGSNLNWIVLFFFALRFSPCCSSSWSSDWSQLSGSFRQWDPCQLEGARGDKWPDPSLQHHCYFAQYWTDCIHKCGFSWGRTFRYGDWIR